MFDRLTAGGGFQAHAGLRQSREQDHVEEVGRAVHRFLADVPYDPMALREMLRVAEKYGGIFLRMHGEIVLEQRQEAEKHQSGEQESVQSVQR